MEIKEVKDIIKNERELEKDGESSTDCMLHIIYNDNSLVSLWFDDIEAKNVKLTGIKCAIYTDEFSRGIYLKSGLKTYRELKKLNIV